MMHTLACLVFRGLRPWLICPTQPALSLLYSLDLLLPNGLARIEFCCAACMETLPFPPSLPLHP